MRAENVPAWLSMSCRTYMPPLVTMDSPMRYMTMQATHRTTVWLALPHFLGQESTTMEAMVSSSENWVPKPNASSIVKNSSAHSLEPGRRDTASGYTTKASPGPGKLMCVGQRFYEDPFDATDHATKNGNVTVS